MTHLWDGDFRAIGSDVQHLLRFLRECKEKDNPIRTHHGEIDVYLKVHHLVSTFKQLKPEQQHSDEVIFRHYEELYDFLQPAYEDMAKMLEKKSATAKTHIERLRKLKNTERESAPYKIEDLESRALNFRLERVMSALVMHNLMKKR